jgi:hypothetical protein
MSRTTEPSDSPLIFFSRNDSVGSRDIRNSALVIGCCGASKTDKKIARAFLRLAKGKAVRKGRPNVATE